MSDRDQIEYVDEEAITVSLDQPLLPSSASSPNPERPSSSPTNSPFPILAYAFGVIAFVSAMGQASKIRTLQISVESLTTELAELRQVVNSLNERLPVDQ